MTTPLFDWPSVLLPSAEIVTAVGNVQDGFISRAGLENNVPIAGARNQLRMQFSFVKPANGPWAAWLIQNAHRGWFRVPLHCTPQLASTAAIAAAQATYSIGIPFSTGQYFSTGYGFSFKPTLDVSAAASEGATTITLDETRWPDALTFGKVFGLGTGVYHVDDITREGTTLTVTFSPPLRRDIAAGEFCQLRPSLICRPQNIKSFIALFDSVQIMKPGTLTMTEVIDEDYL